MSPADVHRQAAEAEAAAWPAGSAGAAPRKVQLAGHCRVTSWGSTACSSSASRSRSPSPAAFKGDGLQGIAGQKQRSPGKTQAPSLPPVHTIPSSGLRPPPGLSSPPGLFFPKAKGGTPPAVADIFCGKCDEPVEHNLGVEACSSEEGVAHLSAGSVGHPHSCAAACRYVKRKGGCRDGSKCQHCHLCFWSRTAEDAGSDAAQNDAVVVSIGTRGHPHNCGAACQYARRKGGCRDGAGCLKCHACLWQRERPQEVGAPQEAAGPTKQTPQSWPEAEQSFFGDSTEKLTELIAAWLSRQEVLSP